MGRDANVYIIVNKLMEKTEKLQKMYKNLKFQVCMVVNFHDYVIFENTSKNFYKYDYENKGKREKEKERRSAFKEEKKSSKRLKRKH